MVRDALRPQRHELQATAESAGLRLMHSDKVGAYVCSLTDLCPDTPFIVDTPAVMVPENPHAPVCSLCCRTLPRTQVTCVQCPTAYCTDVCRSKDRSHGVGCTARPSSLRLRRAMDRMEVFCSTAQKYEFFAVRMAVRAVLQALLEDPTAVAPPLDVLAPLPFHAILFPAAGTSVDREYVLRLNDVLDGLVGCCVGPNGPLGAHPVPTWLTLSGLATLCSAVQCNAFEIAAGGEEDEDSPLAIAILPLLNQLSHSCSPNCAPSAFLDENGDLCVALVTLEPVSAGTELLDSYVPTSWLQGAGVLERRATIAALRRFVCLCPVCTGEACDLRRRLLDDDEYAFPLGRLSKHSQSPPRGHPRPESPVRPLKLSRNLVHAGLEAVYLTMGRTPPPEDELNRLTPEDLMMLLRKAVVEHIRSGG